MTKRYFLSLLAAVGLFTSIPNFVQAEEKPAAPAKSEDRGRHTRKNDDGSTTCIKEPCSTSGDDKPTPPLRDAEGNPEPSTPSE